MINELKIIVVEGKNDHKKIAQVLAEKVHFVYTYGTLSEVKINELLLPYEDAEVYVLVDADYSGNKIRKTIKQVLPNARHLYTRKMYGQVSATSLEYLHKILAAANFEVVDKERIIE